MERQYSSSVPELDAIEDMHVTEPEAVEAARKLAQLQSRLEEHTDSLEASVRIPPPFTSITNLCLQATAPAFAAFRLPQCDTLPLARPYQLSLQGRQAVA